MTKSTIKKIYQEFNLPINIVKHMEVVAKVSKTIGEKLIKLGHNIDKKTLIHAALLHDVIRFTDFQSKDFNLYCKNYPATTVEKFKKIRKKYREVGHEKGMADLMKNRGEQQIANLIGKHGFFSIDQLKTWEEKILYYSDKRADHDKIVTLRKRFTEGRKRNFKKSDDLDKIIEIEKKVIKLEKEIVKIIGKQTMEKIAQNSSELFNLNLI